MKGIIVPLLIFLAGISAYAGLSHLMIALRRFDPTHALFALLALLEV